jgi:hypothetical protein
MGIFGPPDLEKLRREGDIPRLIYWALVEKEPALSRDALTILREDVYLVVQYLYETAVWGAAHSVGRRKRLPSRAVKLLNEAVKALAKVGRPAVTPLTDSITRYDQYGASDDNARVLYHILVFDILQRIGRPSVGALRELAADRHGDVRKMAREALDKFEERGLLDGPEDETT